MFCRELARDFHSGAFLEREAWGAMKESLHKVAVSTLTEFRNRKTERSNKGKCTKGCLPPFWAHGRHSGIHNIAAIGTR